MSGAAEQPDVYVACHGNLVVWGGGVIVGHGVASACVSARLSTVLLGFGDHIPEPTTADGIRQLQVRLGTMPGMWRVKGWLMARQVAQQLKLMPPPRIGFVSL
ncbi:MAG: hypothetical protein JXO22_07125, partial [Phycisphaerae bacterium]|nr:hypothetical protein [Phycisphaerae bacterium]